MGIVIVKDGNRKYYKPINWFMLRSEHKGDFYKVDKRWCDWIEIELFDGGFEEIGEVF
ncbi:hypothetical protein QQ020_13225 [Fulvivirgaceae bacterium BMA12]|uniref:Phage protein n=1 Tax=Agaribacillus aureus TaxID=3051825 RepID=A0ABT8L5K5_9BACT|nr:hypothetical protein [Fulvivirgaceae bacterium BMA12]